MFITFEGCDGSGKSTQIRFAEEYLISRGFTVVTTREPGGSPIAESIRAVILSPDNKAMTGETEFLLYAAARVQHADEVIRPSLNRGEVVLCDRYLDSTIAYQGVARGLGVDKIIEMFESTCGLYPDLTLWLDVRSEKAFERKGGVDIEDRLELEGALFHSKVYEGYEEATKRFPNRIRRVDASGTKFDTKAIIEGILAECCHV